MMELVLARTDTQIKRRIAQIRRSKNH